jgi:hypothetical protein
VDNTVKISIEIGVSTEGVHDTGLTVAQWNALSLEERSAMVAEMWSTEAGDHDNGGMSVVTEGATEI